MGSKSKAEYVPSKTRIPMTPGDMVRELRDLQGMSQLDLSKATDIPQPTISNIEHGRDALGVERATRLARALGVHPSVILFPNREGHAEAEEGPTRLQLDLTEEEVGMLNALARHYGLDRKAMIDRVLWNLNKLVSQGRDPFPNLKPKRRAGS